MARGPAIRARGLSEGDWKELWCFKKDEVAAACQDGAWQKIDAGSFYLLDDFANYLVGGKRLISQVQFLPTRTKTGIPTATWNAEETKAHAADSLHYRGQAFDLMFPKNALATAWLTALRFGRWGGIGAYPFWKPDPGLHLDTRWVGASEEGVGFRVLWWVTREGKYRYLNSEEDIMEFLGALKEAA